MAEKVVDRKGFKKVKYGQEITKINFRLNIMTAVDKLSISAANLKKYIKKIESIYKSGRAHEETYCPHFLNLLKDYFNTDEFEVLYNPSSDEEKKNKPDFIVYIDDIPIINIEAKNPGDDIEKWLKKESNHRLFHQVFRYRGGENGQIPVLITDFINIWTIDKETPNSEESDHIIKEKHTLIDISSAKWKSEENAPKNLSSAIGYLTNEIVISIQSVSSLIIHLVKYAKELKQIVLDSLSNPEDRMRKYLEGIKDDFLESIFSSDKEKKSSEFADLFAQTLIYGSFIAWIQHCKLGKDTKDFAFDKARDYLPYGTFIYDVFANLSSHLSPSVRSNIIQKIEKIYQSTEYSNVISDSETLIITFYSDFLNLYDPELAKDRGIVYTPHPIINFIIRGVDYFLKTVFCKEEGIISEELCFLDPASGTMGFICEMIKQAKEYFEDKYSKQKSRITSFFNKWVHEQFLNNFYAFEILMAPYVLGHLKTTMLLTELKGSFNPESDRIKLYLFNTLMDKQLRLTDFRNPTIGEEIFEALRVRSKQEILAIVGNPPYNVSSQNKFDWIERKINFNKDNGKEEIKKYLKKNKGLDKNEAINRLKILHNDYHWDLQREGTKDISGITSLNDDYVKFIRFAQWKVKQNGHGIVGFITNNFYLDGLQFRGMRSSLKRDFDQIYVINLQGDARKGLPQVIFETGIKKDENVFGIKVGVAIVFFIRKLEHSDESCDIKYIEKWGSKFEKFTFLEQPIQDLLDSFDHVEDRIDYEFSPDQFARRSQYMEFIYLIDVFKKHISGIKTGHDHDIMGYTEEETTEKITNLFEKYQEPPNNPDVSWNPRDILQTSSENSISKIILWNWRGFDKRFISYDDKLISRPRFEILQFLLPEQDNIGLIINRQSRGCKGDSSFFISDTIFDNMCCEGSSGLHSYSFPLKINNSEEDDDFNNPKDAIHSNIRVDFKGSLSYGDVITDAQIFYYIYGIFFSPTYRQRYYLGLAEDYPRIPFVDNEEIFEEMANLGKKIADLHLFKDETIDSTQFPMSESTDYTIYYIRRNDKEEDGTQIRDTYDPETSKLYFKKRTKTQIKNEKNGDPLNEITWIGGITEEMWNFEVGGRQQLKEWLYPRRYSEEPKKNTIQRALTDDELDYFLKMCDVIKKTIDLLPKLDQVYLKIDP
ncbi:MAG: type ISP restriction/modification enzyme [Promethearchaeota archaeon]